VAQGTVRLARCGNVWFGTAGMTGTELKTLRRKLGLSLARAARQVEVSARTWARWEAGEQTIPDGAVKLFKIMNRVESVTQ
jgi:DNA-binding transcriptional regulator YiaG